MKNPLLRLFAIGLIFFSACVGWMALGGVTSNRTSDLSSDMYGQVADLWGRSQAQSAPTFTFHWETQELVERVEEDEDGKKTTVQELVTRKHSKVLSAASTQIDVDMQLDQRRKGLMWYPLYDVAFDGDWTWVNEEGRAGWLAIGFAFPDAEGIYDGFELVVDGTDRARELRPQNGHVGLSIPVVDGQEVSLGVAYGSRGMTEWRYVPAPDVANLEDFSLAMTTDFHEIDFPSFSMSPSEKSETADGWALAWTFDRVVTGHDIGMVTPTRIQPGELATELAFSAPVSLLFFFGFVWVMGAVKKLDIHPINYAFVAAAFFAFHLLFAYSADVLPVYGAFALSSVVSVLLVVSYLRLAVGNRFAFVEAGIAQMVYLVGFSMAHFWEGYTGLTITVIAIMTLFLFMQLTGRIKWSEVLSKKDVEIRWDAPSETPAK